MCEFRVDNPLGDYRLLLFRLLATVRRYCGGRRVAPLVPSESIVRDGAQRTTGFRFNFLFGKLCIGTEPSHPSFRLARSAWRCFTVIIISLFFFFFYLRVAFEKFPKLDGIGKRCLFFFFFKSLHYV